MLHSVFSPAFKTKCQTDTKPTVFQPPPPPPPPPPVRNHGHMNGIEYPGPTIRKKDFPSEVIIRPGYKSPCRTSKANCSASPSAERFHTPEPGVPSSWYRQAESGDCNGEVDHDVFFSPQAPMLGTSYASGSDGSSASLARNSSFKTLETIEMLNYEFVQTCKSERNLKRVIDALRNEQEQSKSALLQAATQRLTEIKQDNNLQHLAIAKTEDDNSPGQEALNNLTHNLSRITTGNSTIESIHQSENTLLMSLSPSSVLQGVDLVDSPSGNTDSKQLCSISERNAPPNGGHSKRTDKELSEEVKRLKKEAQQLEATRIAEQRNFAMKLQKLDVAKKNAEDTVNTLRGKVAKASIRAQDLIGTMQKVLKDGQQTRSNFELERKKFEESNKEAKKQEDKLRRKVEDLSRAMEECSEQSRLKLGAERCLRMYAERDLTEKKSQIEELNKILRETRSELEEMKRQRSQFRERLLTLMGLEDSEVCSQT